MLQVKMAEIAKIPNYQVKVDNWSLFFLQRLHHFYKKDYHCDLTLVFSTINTIKSIKVHRLVLHACTDYFESLEVTNDSEYGQCMQLSDEMHPDVVIPIISFMYTGKLEFPASLQSRLYAAASKLRMTILTKLLDAQPKQPGHPPSAMPAEGLAKPPKFKCSTVDDHSQDSQQQGMHVMQILSNFSEPPPSKQSEEPIVAVAPGSSTHPQKVVIKSESISNSKSSGFDALKASTPNSNVFKTKAFRKDPSVGDTTPKAKVVDVSLPPTLPGRKLPIWKRKVPYTGPHVPSENTGDIPERFTEVPKPTRFEWDEDLNDPTSLRPVEDAFRALSYDITTVIQHPIILDGETTSRQKDTSITSNASNTSCIDIKRASPSSPGSPESPPFKRSKADLQDMKEYGKQQQLRNKILCNEDNSEDGMDPDEIYGSCDEESQDFSGSQSLLNSSTPKPILKSMAKPECSQPASKKVRFSLEGKENNKKPNESPLIAKKAATVLTKQKIVLPMNVNQMRSGGHHVKIVSEVLKKYPNLTKRDNVKLKVVSKIPAAVPPTVQHAVEGDGTGNKSATSHVSYIYLMNENPNNSSNVQMVGDKDEKLFDVENRIGPWFCTTCGTPSEPIEFESYFHYRRHLVDIHELKIDARICEYCGLKSSKRNHLLYHLYTKHNIAPPPHVSFPKCSDCNYIALSDALLIKHKAVHESKDLLTCYVCNVAFKTFSSMQIHLQSVWHKKRVEGATAALPNYPCPFCENQFASGGDLKDHIEGNHQSQLQYSEENDTNQQLDSAGSGESQESTDLESLNNVASGIVTSLNLVGNEQAVVYYEQQAGHQDIGREATVMTGEECKDFIIPGAVEDIEPGNEYQRSDQQTDDVMSIENDDSNSRASNVEVNPTSCSDHDYSEPQSEDTVRQVIPLQQVADNFQGAQIIQQILPEQQLVFTPSQPTVVYQSSRLNIPQRVLLTTSGNMVLSQISHAGQNVILPQVIPQARIILSNQIIQPPANIIQEDSGSTIVFTNPEVHPQEVEHVESLEYPNMEASTGNDKEQDSKDIVVIDENDVVMQQGINLENLNVPQINDEGINEQGMNVGGINEQGLNAEGIDEQGLNVGGINEQGLNVGGIDEQGMNVGGIDEQGLNVGGIDGQGMNVGGGIDERGMNVGGIDGQGINPEGIDEQGMNVGGIDGQGLNAEGIDGQGLNAEGIDEQGLNAEGIDEQGLNAEGIDEQGLNAEGIDEQGLNAEGIDGQGLNAEGIDEHGLKAEGIDEQGLNAEGIDGQGLNAEGIDEHGLKAEGIDEHGLNAEGIDEQGMNAERIDEPGMSAEEIDEPGMSAEEIDEPGMSAEEIDEPGMSAEEIDEREMNAEEIGEQGMNEGDVDEETMNEEDMVKQDMVEQQETCEKDIERPLSLDDLMEQTEKKEEEEVSSSILQNRQKPRTMSRGESAKIVDEWDETNETVQNVECRKDGPSRPDFF